ncbi:MAG: HPr family phosphocarrier protein [Planctomycetota bacterium]|nr:MAG: HPr family phosphocarrier protein [Planctomycetota bacterium]
MSKVEKTVEIINKYGLHARPAMKFVEMANQFESNIWVSRNGEVVNGKSVMELMILAAACGTKLKIQAEGKDAKEAVESLASLVNNKFGCHDE